MCYIRMNTACIFTKLGGFKLFVRLKHIFEKKILTVMRSWIGSANVQETRLLLSNYTNLSKCAFLEYNFHLSLQTELNTIIIQCTLFHSKSKHFICWCFCYETSSSLHTISFIWWTKCKCVNLLYQIRSILFGFGRIEFIYLNVC